jgi:hypothetical protein
MGTAHPDLPVVQARDRLEPIAAGISGVHMRRPSPRFVGLARRIERYASFAFPALFAGAA